MEGTEQATSQGTSLNVQLQGGGPWWAGHSVRGWVEGAGPHLLPYSSLLLLHSQRGSVPHPQFKEGKEGGGGRARQEPLGVWGCQKVGACRDFPELQTPEVGGATGWASLMVHFVRI